MTFSIAGRCSETGMLGVAITTSSICVGARCPWARATVGAVSTQNVTLPSIGPKVLDQIATGDDAGTALRKVMETTEYSEYRQVVAIDSHGTTAAFSGSLTLGCNAVHEGSDCVAGGNLLLSEELPMAMADNFESNSGYHLANRLLTALEYGLNEAGGEEGPVRSAALLVASDFDWPFVDLRVDWNESAPVEALRRLWSLYEPQMDDYVARALNPSAAPSFGVPGDR